MDSLTLFGLLAVSAMLVFYALEDRSPRYILAFAGACALASLYGFLQGAWPFGVVEAIWSGVAVQRWRVRIGVHPLRRRSAIRGVAGAPLPLAGGTGGGGILLETDETATSAAGRYSHLVSASSPHP